MHVLVGGATLLTRVEGTFTSQSLHDDWLGVLLVDLVGVVSQRPQHVRLQADAATQSGTKPVPYTCTYTLLFRRKGGNNLTLGLLWLLCYQLL